MYKEDTETWVKLTHFKEEIDLWVKWEEVVHMERKTPVKTTLFVPNQEEKPTTQIAMKNGRVVSCIETPEEILEIVGVARKV